VSKLRETAGVITGPATLTCDNYQNYGLKPDSDLEDDFNLRTSIQKALCSGGVAPRVYPFLNKECHLKVRRISASKESVAHILDLSQKMSQAISEGKTNFVQKCALAMIGGYFKSYISLLSDDARKYHPNTHGTNVHIVQQKVFKR
jgi:hypothetical protein